MRHEGWIVHDHESGWLVCPTGVTRGGFVEAHRVDLPSEDSFGTAAADIPELTWVTYEIDGNDHLFEVDPSRRARGIEQLRYKNKGFVAGDRTVPVSDLLGERADQAQRVSNMPGTDLLLISDQQCTWKDPGFPEELERRLQNILDEKANQTDVFVNPYNFVPFPAEGSCRRSEPQGHDRLAPDNLSGTITLTLTARSPLLIRTIQDGAAWRPVRHDGRVVIPGSSMKGALRSLHETLAGGCLRVFDADYVPTYRDPPKTPSKKLTLGVVRQASNGRPTDVQLCDEVVWVRADLLRNVVGDLHTGSTCDLQGPWSSRHQRNELVEPSKISKGSGWVVLLTPSLPRGNHPDYYAAVGRLTDRRTEVSEDAYSRYKAAVEHADDVVRARRGETPELRVKHQQTKQLIGTRQPVETILPVGTVMWVEQDGNSITGVRRSVIWRSPGEYKSGDRIPADFAPCGHGRELCPTCQLFGSADDTTSQGRETHNYRSHIRIGDAHSVDKVIPTDPIELAAASAPRPGSGQMYLEQPEGARKANPDQTATYQWGAPLDNGTPRRLRGRKFYWSSYAGSDAKVKRHLRYTSQSANLTTSAELVAEGTTFSVPIHFENLTRAQLGSLLAACDPNLCLPHNDADGTNRLTIRIGGGKPFGLGIMEPTGLRLVTHSPAQRYLAATPEDHPAESPADLIDVFKASVPEQVEATWPSLVCLLDRSAVKANRVAYPPKNNWNDMEKDSADNPWEAGLDFFKLSKGENRRSSTFVWLPAATDPDQYLPMTPGGDG